MFKQPSTETTTLPTILNSTLHFPASTLPLTIIHTLLRTTGRDTEPIEMTGALEGLECRNYGNGIRGMEEHEREEDIRVVEERRGWTC